MNIYVIFYPNIFTFELTDVCLWGYVLTKGTVGAVTVMGSR